MTRSTIFSPDFDESVPKIHAEYPYNSLATYKEVPNSYFVIFRIIKNKLQNKATVQEVSYLYEWFKKDTKKETLCDFVHSMLNLNENEKVIISNRLPTSSVSTPDFRTLQDIKTTDMYDESTPKIQQGRVLLICVITKISTKASNLRDLYNPF